MPGAAELVNRIGEEIGHLLAEEGKPLPTTYPAAFSELVARKSAAGRNELVRGAVLEACVSGDEDLMREAREGRGDSWLLACRQLESDLNAWVLGPGHDALARIVVGYPDHFGTVLTTNFDPLLSVAIARAGTTPTLQVLEKDGSLRSDQMKAPRVVHAHGFWRGKNMLHTEQQLTGHRPALASSLGRLFEGATVVALGYGGWEDVFTRKLAQMSGDEEQDFELLWTFYPSAKAEVETQLDTLQTRLAGGLALDRVVFYSGVDGHAVLPALWERLRGCSEPLQIRQAAADYRAWAADHHSHLDLIGLEAGSGRLPLTEVYVSLEAIAHRRGELGSGVGGRLASGEGANFEEFAGEERIELDEHFRFPEGDSPHLAVFGDAGSGKTTVLEKLFGMCLEASVKLGLAEGTLPIFVKLSRLPAAVLTEGLPALVAAALEQEGVPGGDLAGWLWQRGRLLLLCDGLDEIRDPGLRKAFCEHLSEQLAQPPKSDLRAVISCRREGYGDHLADLGPTFLHLEVQPLGPDKSERLVKQWFAAVEAAKTAPFDRAHLAHARKELLQQLNDPRFRADRRLAMISSPLLLTLLCLLVARGGEMPRHRATFFAEALRLLLGRWQAARGDRPPIPVDRALALLAPIAWKLHAGAAGGDAGRTDIAEEDLVEQLGKGLALQRSGDDPAQLVKWLSERAAILEKVGDDRYAFRHLRFQECLSALFVASRRGEALDFLLRSVDQRWSREVTALLVGLPGFGLFGEVMARLLPERRSTEERFYRQLIEEAAELDVEPLVEALSSSSNQRSRALRRLAGLPIFHRPLAELLLRLIFKGSGSVPLLAAQRLLEGTEPRGSEATPVPVLPVSERERLRALAGRNNLDRNLQDKLRQLVERDVLWVECIGLVIETVEGANFAIVAEEDPQASVGDVGSEPEPISVTVRTVTSRMFNVVGARKRRPILGEPFTEPATGIRFLWVPGGRLRMGDEELGEKERDVDVAPFWLAETAVTNDQYGRFLAANEGHDEPGAWRNPRFSDPRQPVVAVSWHDARDFCAWLASRSGLQVALPEEAKWEFAARSGAGRRYPWASRALGDALADHGQDYFFGRPAPVGSFSGGAGPFGHLDLAGGVWEWCEDDLGGDRRPLRGGSWAHNADNLPSAPRNWLPAWHRHRIIGFRVAAVPPSP